MLLTGGRPVGPCPRHRKLSRGKLLGPHASGIRACPEAEFCLNQRLLRWKPRAWPGVSPILSRAEAVIVDFSELSELRGKVAMVDGAFDPLHQGHVEYFEQAAGLGLPLICSVASDAYVATKHKPLLSEQQRLRVIDALKPISYVVLNHKDTETVLEALQPKCYVKGIDWEGRLPERQVEICRDRLLKIFT